MKAIFTLLLLSATAMHAQTVAVRFGKLVDGSGRVIENAVVVVNGETVTRVASGDAAVPAGARVIDLRRYTGIPGMIDAHTHITYGRAKPADGATVPAQQSMWDLRAWNALKTLESGVTTVRDLGASGYADIAMRDSIARGVIPGPRIFLAGYGLSKSAPAREGAPSRAPQGRVSSIADIEIAVKAQVDAGVDWIKMYGSAGSFANVSGTQTFNFDEMKAAVDVARKFGKPIAIHSYGPEGARDAARAGANTIEHATDMDDATIADFVARRTIYVPTIDHNRFYAENAVGLRYTPEQVAGLNAYRARNMESARRAFRAGVKFAMGSDAVYWMFGENTNELRWFVEIGMTPAQALATATTNGAEMLGMSNKLGKVAPGFFADIVAVEGDPLSDIAVVIQKVRWVMKGGAVVVDKR